MSTGADLEPFGLRGRLISASFVRDCLEDVPGIERPPRAFVRQLEAWCEHIAATLGPASSTRAIADAAVVPLLALLDLQVSGRREAEDGCILETRWWERRGPDVLVAPWQAPLGPAWRAAIRRAIAADARWAFCTNGTALRVVDARRTWSRDFLEFDLTTVHRDVESTLLWTLARGPSITAHPSLLDGLVELSASHGIRICRTLGQGVVESVGVLMEWLHARRRPHASSAMDTFEGSLTVLYRVLFLLYAEARGLVPVWHPVYRDRYSLERIVEALLALAPPRGLWHAVQAISRLARGGCVAGELRVNAFNGRLFASSAASLFDHTPVPDPVMARAIMAVASQPARAGGRTPGQTPTIRHTRRRVLYRDLDVEQLGAVYEQALEYKPVGERAPATLQRTRDVRKSSGTFYTPRAVTDYVVRRTLEPLVHGRSGAQILALRVLDPAMGSGAFLVAACRYLAAAVERAFIHEGRWHIGDVTAADRVAIRRDIALRCLYGVDVNPMAVQLGRLSLWLATMAADKPLSFLDHHLVAGDSLVGATPDDVQRRPSRVAGRRERSVVLPLFESPGLGPALEQAVRTRVQLELDPDDSAEIVHRKERELATLTRDGTTLGRWRELLDLWCAGWFWGAGTPPGRSLFMDLADRILHGRSALPSSSVEALRHRAGAIARERRFLHWPLTFPEVFGRAADVPGAEPGFDAVIGNPPWDMVRGDSGDADLRRSRREQARQLADFVRESGVYLVDMQAHVNRYQLFVQRALQLARRGGRIGLVLPSGIARDIGAAALRRHVFDRADVDSITGLDNRAGIFPIHRGVGFALLTATAGTPTVALACRFGLTRTEQLDASSDPAPLLLSRRLLARLSGADDLGIPDIGSELDLRILEGIAVRVPRLEEAAGWSVKFGRELNASDDRARFRPFRGGAASRRVVEGKQIEPFRLRLEECRFELKPGVALPPGIGGRPRIAYRDVASATNRLTLIAAILPSGVVSTHTLFCLRTPLRTSEQHALCALLNSFVANYLVRLRVTTHVTVSLVARLPVPRVRADHPEFARLSSLARTLSRSASPVEQMHEYADLQALCARLYGLTAPEFEHVLSTFPLIEPGVRRDALDCFERLSSETGHPPPPDR